MGANWSVVRLPDGSARIDVRGEIDLAAETPLVDQVSELATGPEAGVVLLDLGGVEFIDSSGVRALLRVHQAHGDRVRLVAVSDPVQRVLEIAGLTSGLGLETAAGEPATETPG